MAARGENISLGARCSRIVGAKAQKKEKKADLPGEADEDEEQPSVTFVADLYTGTTTCVYVRVFVCVLAIITRTCF